MLGGESRDLVIYFLTCSGGQSQEQKNWTCRLELVKDIWPKKSETQIGKKLQAPLKNKHLN